MARRLLLLLVLCSAVPRAASRRHLTKRVEATRARFRNLGFQHTPPHDIEGTTCWQQLDQISQQLDECTLRLDSCESTAAPLRSTSTGDDVDDQDAITVTTFDELKEYAEAAAKSDDPTVIAVKNSILFDSTIAITGTVIIGSATKATLSGQSTSRLFDVAEGASLTLFSFKLVDGAGDSFGGAVKNEGDVLLVDSTVSGHRGDKGGAFYNGKTGELEAFEVDFSSNVASGGTAKGGAIHNDGGAVTLLGNSFSTNTAMSGGAVYNDGAIITTDSDFQDNVASYKGGGLYHADGETKLAITLNLFSGNTANGVPDDSSVARARPRGAAAADDSVCDDFGADLFSETEGVSAEDSDIECCTLAACDATDGLKCPDGTTAKCSTTAELCINADGMTRNLTACQCVLVYVPPTSAPTPVPTPAPTKSDNPNSLEHALKSLTCFDPKGEACGCTGKIDFSGKGYVGTIPSTLSACTGLTSLCVTIVRGQRRASSLVRPFPTVPRYSYRRPRPRRRVIPRPLAH